MTRWGSLVRVQYFPPEKEGGEFMAIAVQVKKGETLDRALRRLKKTLDREGVLKDVRDRRYFEKPSVKRRRKEKAAKFAAYLRVRSEKM